MKKIQASDNDLLIVTILFSLIGSLLSLPFYLSIYGISTGILTYLSGTVLIAYALYFSVITYCGRNFQDMYVFDATDSNTEPSLFDEAEHTYLFSTEWFGGELKRTTQISKWFLNYLGGYPVIIQVMQRKNIKGNDVADEDFTQIRLFMAKRDLENIYLAMENDKWSKPTVYKVMVYEP